MSDVSQYGLKQVYTFAFLAREREKGNLKRYFNVERLAHYGDKNNVAEFFE